MMHSHYTLFRDKATQCNSKVTLLNNYSKVVIPSLPLKAKCDSRKIITKTKRKAYRKPQFSLYFQFSFSKEEEMQATNERFVRLRNMGIYNLGGQMPIC